MSTKYRNPASVAQERVLQLSSQWNNNTSYSYSASSNDDNTSSNNKQKPGKGLIKETRSSRSNYAEEEDARLGDPDAEWKSGYAKSDKSSSSSGSSSKDSQSEDEKAKQTQTKGGKPEKYAKEEDDSLAPEETGAPTREVKKDD